MHPHPNVHRLAVILAISLAACAPGGSPGLSTAPGSSPGTASARPTSGATSAPSPAAIVLPTCTDSYALPIHPALQIANVRGEPLANLRHVVATSTATLGFVVPLPDSEGPGPDNFGTLIGAHPLEFAFLGNGEPLDPNDHLVVTQARATIQTGSAPAVPLGITLRQDDTVVQVPDMSANVTIAMTVEWTDGCFTYKGDASAIAQIVLAAVVAACPTSQDQLLATARALGQTPTKIGSVSHLLTIENWIATYVDGDGNETVATFQDTDFKAAPQPIAAGKSIVVSEAAAEVRIVSINAQFYRLDAVLPDPLNASPEPVFLSTGVVRADGSVAVPVPTTRAKYVMEINVGWASSCISGYGREWVTVQSM